LQQVLRSKAGAEREIIGCTALKAEREQQLKHLRDDVARLRAEVNAAEELCARRRHNRERRLGAMETACKDADRVQQQLEAELKAKVEDLLARHNKSKQMGSRYDETQEKMRQMEEEGRKAKDILRVNEMDEAEHRAFCMQAVRTWTANEKTAEAENQRRKAAAERKWLSTKQKLERETVLLQEERAAAQKTAEVQRRNVERSAKHDAREYQTKLVSKRRQVVAAVKQVEDQRAKVSALRDAAARHKSKGEAYIATLPDGFFGVTPP
jgi:hypothetical protein